MPKKKLTKAQVKRKVKSAYTAVYDLYIDKLVYRSKSDVPESTMKMLEILEKSALSRMYVKVQSNKI